MTIYFHNDFDGAAAAAILGDFFKRRLGYPQVSYEPIGYYLKDDWLTMSLDFPCAAVDFLYRNGLTWWFDHHDTSISLFAETVAAPEAEIRQPLETGSATHRFMPAAKSAASVVYQHLQERFTAGVGESSDAEVQKDLRWRELVKWADIIDSASYESCQQVVESKEPALRIRMATQSVYLWTSTEQKRWWEWLVGLLQSKTLTEAAEVTIIRGQADAAMEKQNCALEYFRRFAVNNDGIVLCDMTESPTPHCRYAPYYFFPDALYSIVLVKSKRDYQVMVGENPFSRPPHGVHVGKLCGEFGGGGHSGVGGINKPMRREAIEAMKEVAQRLKIGAAVR